MDGYTVSGIILGTLIIAILWLGALLKKRPSPTLADGVLGFLTSLGLVAGVRVCLIAVSPNLLQELDGERPYFFIAGIAVIWVSIETLAKLYTLTKND